MAYLETKELAGYVSKKYYDEYGFEISPLKLQKTMYLLFAMWGANARLANKDIEEATRNNDCNNIVEYSQPFDENLFESNFEAWRYGPVDRELYTIYRSGDLGMVSELSVNDNDIKGTILSFIDSICAQTFKINDFALVDLTHKDEAWQSAYRENDEFPSRCMENDSIINEYATRLSSR